MTELLTAAQMRAIEQAAIDSGQVTGLELMERAGAGVVAAIFEEWPELAESDRKAAVLCGPGNNGGDGFVVARLLKARGWNVEVFLYGDEGKLPDDAAENCRRWREMGAVGKADFDSVKIKSPYDLRIDALFGTGLRGPPSGNLSLALTAARSVWKESGSYRHPKRVAVDGPSCLDLDSGMPLIPENIWDGDIHLDYFADLTISFHRLKVGHLLAEGVKYCRKLKVVDIGLEANKSEPEWICRGINNDDEDKSRTTHLEKSEPSEAFAWPADLLWKDGLHKYNHGHALVLSGGPGKGGAARLAARGALRIGAGLVTVGCPADALAEHAAQLNAIMCRVVDGAAGLSEMLAGSKISTLCLGPGLGLESRALIETALKSGLPCVLDADGLSIFENNEKALFELLHPGVVITPHGGEFKRLFPDIAAKLAAVPTTGPAYSKVDATREAAARAGCVVLYKGADTVIADADGRCAISSAHYERAAPWLATAGSGDVLAGFIAGLLARGFAPMQAAKTAAWLHVECAISFGPGLIAEDLPEELPKVFRALEI